MDKKNPSYTDAFNELQEIVREMENSNITVDILSEKIKRCNYLIGICKDKLTKTEAEIAKIVGEENA